MSASTLAESPAEGWREHSSAALALSSSFRIALALWGVLACGAAAAQQAAPCSQHQGRCIKFDATGLSFSLDERSLYFTFRYGYASDLATRSFIARLDLHSGQTEAAHRDCRFQNSLAALSPKGTYIAYYSVGPTAFIKPESSRTTYAVSERFIEVVRLSDLSRIRITDPDDNRIESISFSPDEKHLYYVLPGVWSTIVKRHITTGERVTMLALPEVDRRENADRERTQPDAKETNQRVGKIWNISIDPTASSLIFLGRNPKNLDLLRDVPVGPAPGKFPPRFRTLLFAYSLVSHKMELHPAMRLLDLANNEVHWTRRTANGDILISFELGPLSRSIHQYSNGAASRIADVDERVWQFDLSKNGHWLAYTYVRVTSQSSESRPIPVGGLKLKDLRTGSVSEIALSTFARESMMIKCSTE